MSRLRVRSSRLLQNSQGIAAIEFAFILPIFVTLLMGGMEYCRALSVYRKVTLTTRSVADLTTQYVKMSNNDVATVLNASAQIMTPYDTANLTVILSEISTDALGISTVTWSKPFPSTATPLQQGQVIVMPVGSTQPGTSVILSQVSYAYTPTFGANLVGAITLSDRISMSPRLVSAVNLTGT